MSEKSYDKTTMSLDHWLSFVRDTIRYQAKWYEAIDTRLVLYDTPLVPEIAAQLSADGFRVSHDPLRHLLIIKWKPI